MTQEVLIPKMKKLSKQQRKIKIPVLECLLVLFSILLLIGATFVNINLKHYIIPSTLFSGHLNTADFVYSFSIIPQIPALMFICSSLGKKMASVAVILYILCGLFIFPIFALGGGVQYLAEFSFGYILGYLPAVVVGGSFLHRKYSFLNMFLAALCAVLIIHFLGIIYMIFIALIKHENGTFISGWIHSQSGLKMIYDIVISFVLILMGKYINYFLKFVLK